MLRRRKQPTPAFDQLLASVAAQPLTEGEGEALFARALGATAQSVTAMVERPYGKPPTLAEQESTISPLTGAYIDFARLALNDIRADLSGSLRDGCRDVMMGYAYGDNEQFKRGLISLHADIRRAAEQLGLT